MLKRNNKIKAAQKKSYENIDKQFFVQFFIRRDWRFPFVDVRKQRTRFSRENLMKQINKQLKLTAHSRSECLMTDSSADFTWINSGSSWKGQQKNCRMKNVKCDWESRVECLACLRFVVWEFKRYKDKWQVADKKCETEISIQTKHRVRMWLYL